MRTITVGINETGQRLTRILSKYLRTAPDSFLYRMLRKKNIVLNGHKASGKEILQAGDTILIYMSEDTICKFGGPSLEINTAEDTDLPDAASLDDILIYEDDRLLIVNKPAGMLSQKSKGSDQSLIDLIIAYMRSMGELSDSQMATFRPGLASRLDRNTSGIVIAGKTLASLQELNALTKEHVLS
ncbi:MAG: RluA family pseudouridine synthase, partial [Lachnospiraceae bacterium]|nr:RluA family pseudouridine synthase [Lachnospiraceae bacterium]